MIFSKAKRFHETGVLVALVVMVAVFSLLSEYFLTAHTWGTLLTAATEIGLVALGATMLMTVGEFDLSVGSIFAFGGLTYATAATEWQLPVGVALGASILAGAMFGLLNGLVTVKTRIPSFITTLGAMLAIRGLVLVLTDGFPVSVTQPDWLMTAAGAPLMFGIKPTVFVWLVFCGLLAYTLKHHPLGNRLMATGGNEQAAFSQGIKTERLKIWCFVLSGVLAALAGVIQFFHLQSLSPTAGDQYELRAIAISVIGGTLLTGGVGTIVGTVLGTILMAVLASGLVQAGVSTYWFRCFLGVILIGAVVLNRRIRLWTTQGLQEAKGN